MSAQHYAEQSVIRPSMGARQVGAPDRGVTLALGFKGLNL